MNKKILLSLGTLVVAGAVIAGGTGAFFSDTETSAGNVFTAGSVSIDLLSITHDYYGDDATIPGNYFTTSTAGNIPFFTFGDLKPGDTGEITSTLVNGENDAFFCARTVDVTGNDSDLADLLWFRVNGNSGLPAATTYQPLALGQWFSLDSAHAGNPGAGALAVAANDDAVLELEYCFGTFVAGTPGLAGCTVQNPGDPAVWNDAQNDTISLTTEYYAVQQRNNSGFTCGSLNTPDLPTTEVALAQAGNTYFIVSEAANANLGFGVGLGAPDVPSVTGVTSVEVELFQGSTLLVTNEATTAGLVFGLIESGSAFSVPFRNVVLPSSSNSWNYGTAVDWDSTNEPTKAVITIEHDGGTWVGTFNAFTGNYAAIN